MNYDADDEKHFHMAAKSIGTCVIGGATTQFAANDGGAVVDLDSKARKFAFGHGAERSI